MIFIKLSQVGKKNKKQVLLNAVSVYFTSENVWFLKGPNGCGKSTLIKSILKLVKCGGNIETNAKTIAYAPEKNFLPDYVSVRNFLTVMLAYSQQSNTNDLEYFLRQWDLLKYQHKNINQLSKGNKQKLILIQALIQDADAYFFDEPLGGLDASTCTVFMRAIENLFNQQRLIIIATHYLEKYPSINQKVVTMENYEDLN